MLALLDGRLGAADATDAAHPAEASGLVAAYLQWHLERGLRSLPLVERREAPLRRATARGRPPTPHPSGARPPALPAELVPAPRRRRHGRQRPLGQGPRAAAHRGARGGGGVAVRRRRRRHRDRREWISAYAFSTENWKRSPDEVRFLMGFNRDVIRRRRDEMHALGVRVRWAGRRPQLWRSVIKRARGGRGADPRQRRLTLTMCVNYGGRAEIADAAALSRSTSPPGGSTRRRVDERVLARYLDEPDMPDVDLFLRTSGEQRTSNFLLWQSAYAEMVFLDTLWPDVDRRHLWRAWRSTPSATAATAAPCRTTRRRGERVDREEDGRRPR